jgi:hypothetical protein
MATLSPLPKLYFTGSDGLPLVGGKLYTYQAGTTTPLATYTDSSGGTANSNPVILDSRGEAGVWLSDASYKFVLKDSNDVLIWTQDNVTNGTATSEYASQWLTGVAGTNTLVGTSTYGIGAYSAGLVFRFVPSAINTSSVTLNINSLGAKSVLRQGGLALLPGHLQTSNVHTVVYDGTQFILQNPAINPARVTVASHATTANIWVASDEIDFTGTETITDFPDAPKAGEWRVLHCNGACTFTNNANIAVPGGANYTATAGDIVTVHATSASTFRLDILKSDGSSVIKPAATESLAGVVELATTAEVQAGTDTGRVPSVASLRAGAIVTGAAIPYSSFTSTKLHDFTGIPSWVKRITITFKAISLTASTLILQIGDSGGVETSGYVGILMDASGSGTNLNPFSSSFVLSNFQGAADASSGSVTLYLHNAADYTWTINGALSHEGTSNRMEVCAGYKSLSTTLDRVRITSATGGADFDAGSINLLYE